jgi:hypothetical protein
MLSFILHPTQQRWWGASVCCCSRPKLCTACTSSLPSTQEQEKARSQYMRLDPTMIQPPPLHLTAAAAAAAAAKVVMVKFHCTLIFLPLCGLASGCRPSHGSGCVTRTRKVPATAEAAPNPERGPLSGFLPVPPRLQVMAPHPRPRQKSSCSPGSWTMCLQGAGATGASWQRLAQRTTKAMI